MDYHTLVSLYDTYRDAVSELEHACEHFNQAVIDMHSYDISLIGTAEQLRELIDKLECCYKSIIEFQDDKDKESESKQAFRELKRLSPACILQASDAINEGGKPMKKNTRGRKMCSDSVRVFPVFRKEPDIEKLGLALIEIAKGLADKNN